MDWLILPGAAISLLGLVGLLASAVKILRARKQGLEDDEMRARIQRAMVLNFAALMLSIIGLMMVVVGILLS
ncbi:MAG TPA: hypothetical protein ENK28_14755 [Aliiroseovarius sp.]|nr:hypothetical protein [Aliiroseovarius sp.]